MITIHDNLWAEATRHKDDIKKLLRYKDKGYMFSPAYKQGRWDGWTNLWREREGRLLFPAGLVAEVFKQPWAHDIGLTDLRKTPVSGGLFCAKQLVELDTNQEEAIDSGINAGRGIIQYPTGYGKGRIIGETIRRLGVKTLVLVDKLDLLAQLGKEIETCIGVPVSRIGGGQRQLGSCTIATIQSFSRAMTEDPALCNFEAVLIDEGHHVEAATFQAVLKNLPLAFYRLIYSATVFKSFTAGSSENRSTYLKTQAWTGPMIAKVTLQEGVDAGRIVPPTIYVVHGAEWPNVPKAINYLEEVDRGIVNNTHRNVNIVSLASRLNNVVVLVERLDHGEILADALGCPFVQGNTPGREAIYLAFKQGRMDKLVISKIADEALNLPNIEHLILAGGGRAPHRQMQRIGRGMRATDEKTGVLVFDYEDYGKYISAHYRKRRKTYDNEPSFTVVDIDITEI